MIQISRGDSIIEIIEKIEKSKKSKIILHFPSGHPILHSHLSLKILKSKSKDKEFYIKTSDSIGQKICKIHGIPLLKLKEAKDHSHLIAHNYSSPEYFRLLIKQYCQEFTSFFSNTRKIQDLLTTHKKKEKTNILIFMLILTISIILFLSIYYIAINKSYVSIAPETIIKKEALNFILSPNTQSSVLWNNNTIELESISKKIYTSHSYSATEMRYKKDAIASWKIKIYNTTEQEISLRPKTRFQTPDGAIFRSSSWIKIPAGAKDNFWKVAPWVGEVSVSADTHDQSGKLIWERWNIKPNTKLILPWLGEAAQENIYAINTEAFTGGKNDFIRSISEDDLSTTRELFEEKLKQEAYENLKQAISEKNTLNSESYELLSKWLGIRYSESEIQISSWAVAWAEKDNFTYTWNITIYWFLYNKENIIQKLKTIVNEKTIDGIEQIKSINEDSLRLVELIYADTSKQKAKATFEIESLNYYDIWNTNNSYIEILKSKIQGMNAKEAEKVLLNDPRISKVKISNRPFFLQNVSNIRSNIIIEVEL